MCDPSSDSTRQMRSVVTVMAATNLTDFLEQAGVSGRARVLTLLPRRGAMMAFCKPQRPQ